MSAGMTVRLDRRAPRRASRPRGGPPILRVMSPWLLAVLGVVGLLVLTARRGGPSPTAPASPAERSAREAELRQALAAGRKIEAIKLYRCLYGVGLKEAKEAVERLQAGGSLEPYRSPSP
jgi:hypothetical protein